MVKRYSNDVFNTRKNEWSTLSEVTCHHIAALGTDRKFDFSSHLLPPVRPAPAAMRKFLNEYAPCSGIEFQTAHSARISALDVCHTTDVVLMKSVDGNTAYAGQIWFHAATNDLCMSLVSIWEPLGCDADTGARTWRESTDNVMLIPLCDILAPCAYKRDGDTVVTLSPYLYRGFD